jgi:uncharacterized membrane-anchored protein YjiN (DUF445 family)
MVDKNIQKNQNTNVSDYQDLADLMVGQFEKVFDLLEKKPDRDEVKKMIKSEVSEIVKTEVGKIAKTEIKEIVKSEVDKTIKTETNIIMSNITRLNDKIDDYYAEQIGLKRQVGKHEKWHRQTAAKIGLKFVPE